MLKVVKFGGSSVSDAEQFKKVKAIMEADPSRRIAVISAAGKRNKEDHKLTDLLYLCHAHLTYGVSCDDIFDTISGRFTEIRDELGLTFRIEEPLAELRKKLSRDMSVDELVSRGEYLTSRLMAEYLGFHFLDARDCIYMNYDGSFDPGRIAEAIGEALAQYERLVIPGFYGSLPNGKIKVMSRGGSDITGSLAAAAAGASVYENWTDVSGILMSDPRIVENPLPIEKITYAELRELAYMGASVLHEESILPVKEAGISLNIRNTNRPEDPGTMIVEHIDPSEEKEGERFITGISGKKNYSIITVRKRQITSNKHLRHALEVLDHYDVKAENINLGLDSFSVVVSAQAAGEQMYDMVSEIEKTLKPDAVEIQENIALVAAVGRKMTFRPGISGTLFRALGENGINCRTITQGSDELSIMVGVDNCQFEDAVRVLYNGFAG